MNLQDFLNYRMRCPLCSNPLITFFHSDKKQKIRRCESNKFLAIFEMRGLHSKQKTYKIGYAIDELTNLFCIEIYSDDIRMENNHSIDLLNRIRIMNDNLKSFLFTKKCTECSRYYYTSNNFFLNYKNYSIGQLLVANEYFGLSTPAADGYKIYKLYNNYYNKQSLLLYGKSEQEYLTQTHYAPDTTKRLSSIKMPIINFSSNKETTERINNLLIFS